MAIENFISSDVNGIFYPQDFHLNKLNFVTASKTKMDLKRLMLEFSFYEDIFSFAVSGYITVIDAQSFIEMMQLTGNEYLEIDFGKIKGAKNSIKGTYRVYKLSHRKPNANLTSEAYTLHFCSEELLLSEQIKISKSYKGKKISDNIKDILTTSLKVPSKRIQQIEETTGINNLVAPKVKPFEAISWLSNYARPKTKGQPGADMLFFETKNGFNFRSLQTMYNSDVYATYKYQMKNAGDDQQPMQDKVNTVLNYEIVKSYDMLNEINSGTLSNRLITIDPTTRTVRTTNFGYSDYKKKASSLNKGEATPEVKNRLGKATSMNFEGTLKLSVSNAEQEKNAYIKTNGVDSKDVFMENNIPNRTAQIGLANYTIVKIVVPGDPGVTAGRTVNFNIYSLKPGTNKRELDKFYSGKYLVTAVRHIATSPNEYRTVLELGRDSSTKKYASRGGNTVEAKSVNGNIDSVNDAINNVFRWG